MSPNISEELFVDTSRGHKLQINLDIIVPSISCNCKYLTLVALTILILHILMYTIHTYFNAFKKQIIVSNK